MKQIFFAQAAVKQTVIPLFKVGFLVCCVVFSLMGATPADAYDNGQESPLFIAQDDGMYRLQYKLTIPEDSDFWINVRDMIRAGKVIRLTHQVDIYAADAVFGGHVAQDSFNKYVRYNLFDDTYAYGHTAEKTRLTTQLSEVKRFLFSADKPEFLPQKALKTAEAYDVKITLRLVGGEQNGLLAMLQRFFSPQWTEAFRHVAR